jgi:hypothetical protein
MTDHFAREFERRRKRIILTRILLLLSLFYAIPFIRGSSRLSPIVAIVMALALIGLFIFSELQWKCPACDGSFRSPGVKIDPFFCPPSFTCPFCGQVLRQNDR